MNQHQHHFHTLILGGGIAGATAALTLANVGIKVALVVPSATLDGGNSNLAQGGIIYSPMQSNMKALKKDILTAGHNQNYKKAVQFFCKKGPEILYNILIQNLDIPFTKNSSQELNYTIEGGHSTPYVIHCADHTGKSIMQKMLDALLKSPNIQILTHRTAIDIITSHHHSNLATYKYNIVNQCLGAYVFNDKTKEVETFLADWTILATGGLGQIYLHTTNTPSSIGSAVAMAQRAGIILKNLEYVQFHPTALYTPNNTHRFLITEALRGEGARLINSSGKEFMHLYDQRADLAPRDIVSRSIMEELLNSGDPCVYLDLSKVSTNIPDRFPTVYQYCSKQNITIPQMPIPVVPAAHYFCGGILVDLQGQTSLKRLYSVGECSCTGLHGANRLASTSLLEALLWGHAAGIDISRRSTKKNSLPLRLKNTIPDWQRPCSENNEDHALIAQDWITIRHIMWNYVGISRNRGRLQRAFKELRDLSKQLHDFYKKTPISKPIIDLFHGCQAAYSITKYALLNTKSTGCHYRKN